MIKFTYIQQNMKSIIYIYTNIRDFIVDHRDARLNYYRFQVYLNYQEISPMLAHLYLLFYLNVSRFHTLPFSIKYKGSFEFTASDYHCKLFVN